MKRSSRQRCARRSASARDRQVPTPRRPLELLRCRHVMCCFVPDKDHDFFLRAQPCSEAYVSHAVADSVVPSCLLSRGLARAPWQSGDMPHGCLLRRPLCAARTQMLPATTLVRFRVWFAGGGGLAASSRVQSLHNRPVLGAATGWMVSCVLIGNC